MPEVCTEAVFIPCRLDKYVRDATPRSVAAVRAALASGQVQVNGVEVLDAETIVFEDDLVTLSGAKLERRAEQVHLMLNKPLSVTSTLRDPAGRSDLRPYTEQMPPGVFPIGRLDRMTSGLLLFTTDGDLANAVLHPDHHTDKLYWLWLDEHVLDDDARLSQLCLGVPVLGRMARVKSVEIMHRTTDCTELHVTLSEGKNRQIRRMARALNFYLHGLHRKQVGPLTLGDLAPGEFRQLSEDEVDALWHATGGRERVAARKIAALVRFAEACRARGRHHERVDAWLADRAETLRRDAG